MKGRASLESVEKALSAGDKKEEKKRKDKKSGMLSGLFKRKDRKSKAPEDEDDVLEKVSEESSRSSPQPKTSSESITQDVKSPPKQQLAPQRQTSKLQKAPPPEISPVKNVHPPMQLPSNNSSTPSSPTKESAGPSIRNIRPERSTENPQQSVRVISPEASRDATVSPVSPISPERRTPNGDSLSPVKTTFFNSSISSLDFPKPSDRSPTENPSKGLPQVEESAERKGLGDSPVHVSPVAAEPTQGPPGLMADTDEHSASPVSPQSSSPVLVDVNDTKADDVTPSSTVASFATAPNWNDTSLRTYLEDGSDLRDLIIIVHDKSNVPPAGADHPLTGSLFKDENKKLTEMSSRLDDMLSGWLARKGETKY